MKKYKTISEFIEDLDSDKKAQIEMLRSIIIRVEPALFEHIKWNAPSYQLSDEDRITFNLINKAGLVKLLLHMGATRKENKKAAPIMHDDSGLLEWNSDIRATITFRDLAHINEHHNNLARIIKQWLLISHVPPM